LVGRAGALTIPLVTALLVGCGASSDDGADPAPSSSTGTPPTATTATGSPTTTVTATTTAPAPGTGPSSPGGCPATGATVPAGATQGPSADLDGDGRTDTLWLADATGPDGALVRTLGVATASGGVFSIDFTSAAPQQASAIGQRLSGDGPAVVLLNAGRSVPLYAVVDCRLVPTANAQGQQYTFDLGFTGYGTGVACEPVPGAGGDLALFGLLAHQVPDGTWTVSGTHVELSQDGRRADNGPSSDLVTGAASPDVPSIAVARTVACGDQTGAVTEPPS